MLYIVTAVHNRYKITEKFIENLKTQTYKEFKIILVDDGSTDKTDKMVLENFPDAVILYGDGNLWWGGALQKAFEHIVKTPEINDNDLVLIMNDDAFIENDFLKIGTRILLKNTNSLVTACGYSLNSGKQIDGAVSFDYKTGSSSVLEGSSFGNCASTRALFLRVCDMKKIGGFHKILLPHYASDYEYTIRAHKKGLSIIADSELKYIFDEGTTGIKDKTSLTFKNIFSKRSVFNPIYRFSFIFLATPIKFIPVHLKNQILRYLKQ